MNKTYSYKYLQQQQKKKPTTRVLMVLSAIDPSETLDSQNKL